MSSMDRAKSKTMATRRAAPVVLIVDEREACDKIAVSLGQRGPRLVRAHNATEALQALAACKPDLVLLNVAGSNLHGRTVLHDIRASKHGSKISVFLLADMATRASVLQSAQLGVQGYLIRSECSTEDIVERVMRHLYAETPGSLAKESTRPVHAEAVGMHATSSGTSWTGTGRRESSRSAVSMVSQVNAPATAPASEDISPLAAEDIRLALERGAELRPLSPTVQYVMSLTANTSCNVEDLAKAIGADQALCIRLLRLANSAAYCRGRPVDNVKAAVQRIGIQQVRSLVMTLSVIDQYDHGLGDYVNPQLFWEHSVACGLIASVIAQRLQAASDDYFLWGLLHDVGRLILMDQAPDRYRRVCESAYSQRIPLEVAETQLLGIDHCEALRIALKQWRFPDEFVTPASSHHQAIANLKRWKTKAPATIALADRLARGLLLGSSGNKWIHPVEELIEFLELETGFLADLRDRIPAEMSAIRMVMLARATGSSWPEYAQEVQQAIVRPVRALCASHDRSPSVLALFFDRIRRNDSSGPPNLGVIYARHQGANPAVVSSFETMEKDAECQTLPVLWICQTAQPVQTEWLQRRRHAVVNPSAHLQTMIEAVNGLLAPGP